MIGPYKDIFHVHTYRCGHAENVSDEDYIKQAVKLGATGIWFTDHAPFPGDKFGNRMRYDQLPEYLSTLTELKKRYLGQIDVHIGLEIEYFPLYDRAGYYVHLLSLPEIEILLLGQHMAELQGDKPYYTFSLGKEILKIEEYKYLGGSMIQGIETGYFKAVAHPDRIFRRQKVWTDEFTAVSKDIILAAENNGIALEQNEASKKRNIYRQEFWNIAGDRVQIVHGLDAHHLKELKLI